jgi:hypothetical protein
VSVADYLRLDEGEQDPFANVDYIMQFENLADDFCAVCTAICIWPPTLPQYNRQAATIIRSITMRSRANW